jgi:hypothetical protein
MGVYDKLRDHLRAAQFSEMVLTFREIEDIIGRPLPDSAVSVLILQNGRDCSTRCSGLRTGWDCPPRVLGASCPANW